MRLYQSEDILDLRQQLAARIQQANPTAQTLVLAVRLGGVGGHPHHPAAQVGGALHGSRIQSSDLDIQGHSANQGDFRNYLIYRIGHRLSWIFMTLQHQAPHSHFPGLTGHGQSVAAPLYPRVRGEVHVDVHGAFKDPVDIAHGHSLGA